MISNADHVMELLGKLNSDRNLTLLIVTHYKAVSARQGRQASMTDGHLWGQHRKQCAPSTIR
jgi:predicted ABC-type transport system involved in lysophospholipase L1 biosynthesis ATPase subunit